MRPTDSDRIAELEEQVEDLEAEIERLVSPPPDWFTKPEPFEDFYKRLHPQYPDVRGTGVAASIWQNALNW